MNVFTIFLPCRRRVAYATLIFALLAGCATPAERADSIAAGLNFTRQILPGRGFAHIIYSSPGLGNALHVYLENDGTPWLARFMVSGDPTPRHPLMLELMALDPVPSLYLGRPCYFAVQSRDCSPSVWTHDRYSETVVTSLAAVLRQYLDRSTYRSVALLGHSGGGTLALLLAERIPETIAVVTLAGNLDVQAWTAFHGYTPLSGSLDPARQPPLDPRILQWHYIGGRDENVPPSLSRAYAARRPASRIMEIPEYNHQCCWREIWREILSRLSEAQKK